MQFQLEKKTCNIQTDRPKQTQTRTGSQAERLISVERPMVDDQCDQAGCTGCFPLAWLSPGRHARADQFSVEVPADYCSAVPAQAAEVCCMVSELPGSALVSK